MENTPLFTDALNGSHHLSSYLRNAKILVAEDDEMVQFILRRIFSAELLNITMVSNGKACVEVLTQDPDYDLLLLDLNMPEMNGLEAIRIIRDDLNIQSMIIVAMTANLPSELSPEILQAGFNDYITKPVLAGPLFEMISRLIKPKK